MKHLRISLDDDLVVRLLAAKEKCTDGSLADLVAHLISTGLTAAGFEGEDPADRLLATMRVGEFVALLGVNDMAAARENHARSREASGQIVEKTTALFSDVNRLVATHTRVKFDTAKEIIDWAHEVSKPFIIGHRGSLHIAWAWSEDAPVAPGQGPIKVTPGGASN